MLTVSAQTLLAATVLILLIAVTLPTQVLAGEERDPAVVAFLLSDDAARENLLHVQQAVGLLCRDLAHGHARPLRDEAARMLHVARATGRTDLPVGMSDADAAEKVAADVANMRRELEAYAAVARVGASTPDGMTPEAAALARLLGLHGDDVATRTTAASGTACTSEGRCEAPLDAPADSGCSTSRPAPMVPPPRAPSFRKSPAR